MEDRLGSTTQTGLGTPRSADDHVAEAEPPVQEVDAAISTGARVGSHGSEHGTGGANRSGMGGTGGPGTGDPSQEGSTGQSLEELLTGEPAEEPERP